MDRRLVVACGAAIALSFAWLRRVHQQVRSQRSNMLKRHYYRTTRSAPAPVPVLLITDIGRDIDDTLAFLALNGYRKLGKLKIVGIVATGGAGQKRARVSRAWLRRFGISDEVPVAACRKEGREECYVPPGTPSLKDASIFDGSAADLIARLADAHKGELQIFAIGPLSSLAASIADAGMLQRVRTGVRRIWIQGQWLPLANGRLRPDFSAFNLREDRAAAEIVFEQLQDAVPFAFLGKHAAYRVSLTKRDFLRWDEALMASGSAPELVANAKANLDIFRRGNPDLFNKLYASAAPKAPPLSSSSSAAAAAASSSTGSDWFEHLAVLSHPYDPLLLVMAFDGHVFDEVTFSGPASSNGCEDTGKQGDGCVARPQCVVHAHVGNSASSFSEVPDSAAAHDALCRAIFMGLPLKVNPRNNRL